MATLPERAALLALGLALAACARETAPLAGEPLSDARVTALAAGGSRSFASFSHTCAVVDAELQCWGAGRGGQLGDALLASGRPLPVRVPGLRDVSEVAAGASHSCAIAGGALYCWGKNDARQLGRSGVSIALAPTEVSALPRPVRRVAAGDERSCAVAGGALWCWGSGRDGALGSTPAGSCPSLYRATPCSAEPLRVEGLAGEPRELALGAAHSCAIAGEEVACWGANERGQLGDGSSRGRQRPAPVADLPGPPTQLAAGASHSCAVAAGRVYCWGANEAGQLGDGSRQDRPRPGLVEGVPGGASALAAGSRHSCALASGRVHCWGANHEGQLGSADAGEVGPVRVEGLDGPVTALAAGEDHSCAVIAAARVVCWGADDFGQLGRGRGAGRGPVQVGPWDRGRIRDVDRDGRIVVVCLGDSNTEQSERRPASWCDELGGLLGDPAWQTVNRGLGGATAAPSSLRPAQDQLDYALAHDAPDVVISAFGTNDLAQQIDPAEIVAAYFRQWRQSAAAGAEFFVALTPPATPASDPANARVEELNELLRRSFPAERLIDFASGLSPSDFVDAVHLAPSGQAQRARAAREALRAAGAPAPGS